MAIKVSNFNKKSVFILCLILLLWIFISVGRTMHNLFKIFTEEVEWTMLTIDQKNLKAFGNDFNLFESIKKKHPERTNVLLYTKDLKPYYYGRYYLYPSLIYHASNKAQFAKIVKELPFTVVVLYRPTAQDIRETRKILKETGKSIELIYHE